LLCFASSSLTLQYSYCTRLSLSTIIPLHLSFDDIHVQVVNVVPSSSTTIVSTSSTNLTRSCPCRRSNPSLHTLTAVSITNPDSSSPYLHLPSGSAILLVSSLPPFLHPYAFTPFPYSPLFPSFSSFPSDTPTARSHSTSFFKYILLVFLPIYTSSNSHSPSLTNGQFSLPISDEWSNSL